MIAIAATPAQADTPNIPTGAPRSPLLNGATPFSQKLIMFEEFGLQDLPPTDSGARLPVPSGCNASPGGSALDDFLSTPLSPAPREAADDVRQNPWLAKINTCIQFKTPLTKSPIEGRPPGVDFAHQFFYQLAPEKYFQSATAGARTNLGLRNPMQRHHFSPETEFGPGGLYYTVATGATGGTTAGINVRLHPKLPVQNANSVWTFDGTLPPKLVMARYGEAILFRHYNALPINPSANRGFGAHEMTTHFHNGHSPGESDGYAGAFFFPGQYYDYRWPLQLAAFNRLNTDATGDKAGSPDDADGIKKNAGDWQETLSTLWFHDHRIDHTAPNVYKGMAGMINLYSGVDRGRETN
jgi:hypothetical protein